MKSRAASLVGTAKVLFSLVPGAGVFAMPDCVSLLDSS
jgi:hypothetical protein